MFGRFKKKKVEPEYSEEAIRKNNKVIRETAEIAYKTSINDMFNAMITFARDCIKTALIINGGAAIAILALAGNIISKVFLESDTGKNWTDLICILPNSLFWYSAGVIAAGASSGIANISQIYFNEQAFLMLKFSRFMHAHVIKDDPLYKKTTRWANFFRWICIILIIFSYFSFIYGSYKIYTSLPTHQNILTHQNAVEKSNIKNKTHRNKNEYNKPNQSFKLIETKLN